MQDMALFADVSVNPELRCGVGAYLVIPAAFLEASPGTIDTAGLTDRTMVQRFEDTSSTKLELQTVLWALQEQGTELEGKLSVYTDSQCVSGLLERRENLLSGNFLSKRTSRPLRNAALYRSFYELHDLFGFDVIKLEGHTRADARDTVRRVFSCVDKKARKALKIWMAESAVAAQPFAGSGPNENWCVYVLRCRNNALYTGMTNNIERRLKEHEQGRGSKFVRSWRPFELVKTVSCKDAGEARRLEHDLKKLTRREKIDALQLHIGPV